MIEVIHTKTLTARKKYKDDGFEWISEWIYWHCPVAKGVKLKFSELRLIINWKNDVSNHWILPGMKYISQFNKMDGVAYTFKMRKEMFDLAIKCGLWDDI